MNKAIFKYKKEKETIVTERVIFKPQMIKESTNFLKDFDNPNVNYIHGYEVDRSGLTGTEIAKYEKLLEEYFAIEFPTLSKFIETNGLDPKKINKKSFKKTGISDLKIM